MNFNTLQTVQRTLNRQRNKALFMMVIDAFAAKPHITVNAQAISALDAHNAWPTELNKHEYISGCIAYRGVPLDIALWPYCSRITVRLPSIHYKIVNRRFAGYGGDSLARYDVVLHNKQTGTSFHDTQDIDQVYATLVKVYDRYQTKVKKYANQNGALKKRYNKLVDDLKAAKVLIKDHRPLVFE